MSVAKTILDHIDRIEISEDVFAKPANEYWALICMWEGMESLFRFAKQCEDIAATSLSEVPSEFSSKHVGKHHFTMIMGSSPAFNKINQALLTSAFHWYCISACQYVRTIGAIAYCQGVTSKKALEYVDLVIPELKGFRDKVAAHFSWSTKNSKDNDAERQMSVMPQISFVNGRFCVGSMTLLLRRNGKESDSSVLQEWSITKTHEQLRLRYHPVENELCDLPDQS